MKHLCALFCRIARKAFLVLALTFASVTGALAVPCVSATPPCAEFVPVRGGPARVLIYRSAPLLVRDEAITHALIVIHGAERDAATSFRIAAAGAVLKGRIENTLIVSPRFAARVGTVCTDDLAADELNWQCDVQLGDWRSGGFAQPDGTLASFDVLDDLLLKIQASDVFPNLRSVVVAGHSAGGQFVTNYEMTNRLHERLRIPPTYVTGNASAYAYPDDERPASVRPGECATFANWPFGLSARSGYAARPSADEIVQQAARRSVTYLVGELDTQPLESGFYGSCAARAQGATRFARGVAFGKHMSERYKAGHAAIAVPGCGHSESCMFLSRAGLGVLFPDISSNDPL
jgi:pimeloyl-ACP methyl ester carboxylesterase